MSDLPKKLEEWIENKSDESLQVYSAEKQSVVHSVWKDGATEASKHLMKIVNKLQKERDLYREALKKAHLLACNETDLINECFVCKAFKQGNKIRVSE